MDTWEAWSVEGSLGVRERRSSTLSICKIINAKQKEHIR